MQTAYTPRGSVPIPRKTAAAKPVPKADRGLGEKVRPARRRLRSRAAVLEQSSNGSGPHRLGVEEQVGSKRHIGFHGVHHIGVLCESLERSLEFYEKILGLKINRDRPDNKLPYRGAWLWIGPEMIHLMELPNPDATEGRPVHGGRDTHICVSVESIELLVKRLTDAGVKYTESMSGRPAVFFKDPDMNCLEVVEMRWR